MDRRKEKKRKGEEEKKRKGGGVYYLAYKYRKEGGFNAIYRRLSLIPQEWLKMSLMESNGLNGVEISAQSSHLKSQYGALRLNTYVIRPEKEIRGQASSY